jgi:uncharacterized protein (DUF1697 family)
MATDPSRLLVAILGEARDRRLLEPLLKENWLPDALALGGRAAYLWCSTGILNSRIPPAIDRVLGDAVTSRNWATILKLHALVDAGSGDRRR